MPERRCLRDRASLGLGSSADGSWAERKAAESATLIQVSHPRRLPSESIRKRIDRLVLGHPDWTACCEDRRVRWASCKREVLKQVHGAGDVTRYSSSKVSAPLTRRAGRTAASGGAALL